MSINHSHLAQDHHSPLESDSADLADRLIHCTLHDALDPTAEAALIQRVHAAIANVPRGDADDSGGKIGSRWLAAALVLLGGLAVIGVATLRDTAPPRNAMLIQPQAPQDPKPRQPVPQDPKPKQPQSLDSRTALILTRCLQQLKSGTLDEQRAALGRLGAMAGAAAPALDAMLDAAVSPRLTQAVLLAVGDVAPWAPDQHRQVTNRIYDRYYTANLGEGEPQPHELVARILGRLAVDPTATTEHLIGQLEGPSYFEREFAAECLGSRKDPKAFDALVTAMTQQPPRLYLYTLILYSRNGAAKSRVSASGPRTTGNLPLALARAAIAIRPNNPLVAEAYALVLLDPSTSETEKQRAARMAGALQKTTETVVTALVAALASDDAKLLREVIPAVGILEIDGPAVRERLGELRQHPNTQVAVMARSLLARRSARKGGRDTKEASK